ncbi:fimbrial protein [Providencia manganoxydans]|uniref:fimbrial protein n=1 Tax=Providencia manganoxydans TaxID=2923283 RepID=UPI0034E3ABE5
MQIPLRQLWSLVLSLSLVGVPLCTQSETVQFDGTLVEDACEVYPGDENIELDFGTIVDKYLYLNTRTHSQPFTIRLINCDLVLGKEVQVTFMGTESTALPGLLALNAGSQASGIAIGLESMHGNPVKINNTKIIAPLSSGNNNLNFKAYVQGEPNALSTKTIGRGAFEATTTFILEYE